MSNPIDRGDGFDPDPDLPFKTLTREEAQVFRREHPQVSPWITVGLQALVGIVCAGATWAITQRSSAAWSALYGAATAVLPNVLMARGMTRRTSSNPMAAAMGFMFWEMLKLALAVAMLFAAARVVPGLSWPALLVALIVCVKVNWLALLWRRR